MLIFFCLQKYNFIQKSSEWFLYKKIIRVCSNIGSEGVVEMHVARH